MLACIDDLFRRKLVGRWRLCWYQRRGLDGHRRWRSLRRGRRRFEASNKESHYDEPQGTIHGMPPVNSGLHSTRPNAHILSRQGKRTVILVDPPSVPYHVSALRFFVAQHSRAAAS